MGLVNSNILGIVSFRLILYQIRLHQVLLTITIKLIVEVITISTDLRGLGPI